MVRLTYSIDMALAMDYNVQQSFTNAGAATGTDLTVVYNDIVAKNPFVSGATLIQVYENVVQALATKGIMVVLDNQGNPAALASGSIRRA